MNLEGIVLAAGFVDADNIWGRIAFAGIFLVLAVCLALLPGRFIGQEGGRPPLWKNVRYWAIGIALVQLLVYAVLG
jgi:hypothetical protein